ncbi:MAG: ethylbenzene dehydrogenase-related protein [Bauldia sp.]
MTGPKTDFGTIALHWAIAVPFTVVAATGLRILADEADFAWLSAFDGVLPSDNLWYWHIIGGLCFASALAAYATYVVAARLKRRIRLDPHRLGGLLRGGSQRWSAIGLMVLWIGLAAFAVEVATGVLLYVGEGSVALHYHRIVAFVCVAFPVAHVLAHYVSGGSAQLLRIVRPTRLVMPPPDPDVLALLADHVRLVDDLKQGRPVSTAGLAKTPEPRGKRRPLALATLCGVGAALAGALLDRGTGTTLRVPAIGALGGSKVPTIDGDLSDPIWATAPAVSVHTDLGANLGGRHSSRVEVRAVHDGERIFFAFTWDDPTRSLKHAPLVKRGDGWHVARTSPVNAREDEFAEDQFSVLLSRPTFPLVGAGIHLSPQPIAHYPASSSGRGLHYTPPGVVADVWVWRADHGGLIGHVDDAHFNPPQEPTADERAGRDAYLGGFAFDAGDDCFIDGLEDAEGPAPHPARLPRDLAAVTAAMGPIHDSPDAGEDERARWWMTAADTVPYSVEADQRIPAGTILPGVSMLCVPSGDRADLQGVARWAAGHWTLEISRRLDTRSAEDIAITSGAMMWLAVFDHSATRHTRHVRPIVLEIL